MINNNNNFFENKDWSFLLRDYQYYNKFFVDNEKSYRVNISSDAISDIYQIVSTDNIREVSEKLNGDIVILTKIVNSKIKSHPDLEIIDIKYADLSNHRDPEEPKRFENLVRISLDTNVVNNILTNNDNLLIFRKIGDYCIVLSSFVFLEKLDGIKNLGPGIDKNENDIKTGLHYPLINIKEIFDGLKTCDAKIEDIIEYSRNNFADLSCINQFETLRDLNDKSKFIKNNLNVYFPKTKQKILQMYDAKKNCFTGKAKIIGNECIETKVVCWREKIKKDVNSKKGVKTLIIDINIIENKIFFGGEEGIHFKDLEIEYPIIFDLIIVDYIIKEYKDKYEKNTLIDIYIGLESLYSSDIFFTRDEFFEDNFKSFFYYRPELISKIRYINNISEIDSEMDRYTLDKKTPLIN
jgi:hypothetical protein